MSVHWGGKGPGHVSRWPRGVGAISPYSGATMLLDFLNPVLDPRITFSRGTNATLIDSTGKLTYAPNNLLLRSQEFEDAYWTKFGANFALPPVVTANAGVAPDGTTTADRVQFNCVDNTNSANRSWINPATLSAPAGVRYTGSVWVKAFDTANVGRTIRLAVDNLTSNVFTITADWQRISINGLAVGAIGNFLVETRGTFTTQTADVLLWGAQLEQVTYQTTPSTYVATTASAYYGPRFDYDPVTLAPRGLLIEEARTNTALHSADITNAVYIFSASSATANVTTAPDGTQTADKAVEDNTNATHRFYQPSIVTTTSPFSVSVYLKAAERTFAYFGVGNGQYTRASINLTTGATGALTGPQAANLTIRTIASGNGWWRVIISGTFSVADLGHTWVTISDNGAETYLGNGTSGIYVWGYQGEAGSFATSYIPTVASTVTRSADVATMTGTNFSSWYNQIEGTFVSNASFSGSLASNASPFAASGDLNNYSNWVAITRNATSNVCSYNIITGGVAQSGFTNGAAIPNATPAKAAIAYRVNDIAGSTNGATAGTDTSATLPTLTRLLLGREQDGSVFLNGHIRTIAYYNTRLPNAQLQTLTAPSLATTLSLDFTSGSYNVGF